MTRPTRIFLARHGQTVTNREGRFCGHSETDLTPLGEAQARALGRRLAGTPIAACYTSDFARARRTAEFILEGRGIIPHVDPDLRELHYGEWELERESEIRRKYPAQYRLMRAEDPAWRPPGGESVPEVRARHPRRTAPDRRCPPAPGHARHLPRHRHQLPAGGNPRDG